MDTSSLEYDLPPELVAQVPVEPRDASRLLVYRRTTGTVEHRTFRELPDVLGTRPVRSHLVHALVDLDREYGSEPRDEGWEDWYAARLPERLLAEVRRCIALEASGPGA